MRNLRKRKAVNPPPEPKTKLTSAEKSKRYREALKEDPQRWELFLKKERERKKEERKHLSKEQKDKIRIGNRIRQARYRQRNKLGQSLKPKPANTKMLTRKEREKKRAYWRKKQKECRAKHSSQKVRRKREKDNRYRAALKLQKHLQRKRYEQKLSKLASTSDESRESFSPEALKKASYRLKKYMPKTPIKFAEVINKLVNTASPRKKKELTNKGITSTTEKVLLTKVAESFTNQMKEGQISKAKIAAACNVMKKYRCAKATSIMFGVSPSYACRAVNSENKVRKKRTDATNDDVVKKVEEFYKSPQVSTTVPDCKSVKHLEERMTINRPQKDLYDEFVRENSDMDIGFSTFTGLRPKECKNNKSY